MWSPEDIAMQFQTVQHVARQPQKVTTLEITFLLYGIMEKYTSEFFSGDHLVPCSNKTQLI